MSVSVPVCPRSLVKFPVNFTLFFAQFLISLTEILSFWYDVKSLFPLHKYAVKMVGTMHKSGRFTGVKRV